MRLILFVLSDNDKLYISGITVFFTIRTAPLTSRALHGDEGLELNIFNSIIGTKSFFVFK